MKTTVPERIVSQAATGIMTVDTASSDRKILESARHVGLNVVPGGKAQGGSIVLTHGVKRSARY